MIPGSEPMPTEAQESANAAYLLRVQLANELIAALQAKDLKVTEWRIQRYQRAVSNELLLESIAAEERDRLRKEKEERMRAEQHKGRS